MRFIINTKGRYILCLNVWKKPFQLILFFLLYIEFFYSKVERAINEINDLGYKPEDFQSFALPTELSSLDKIIEDNVLI